MPHSKLRKPSPDESDQIMLPFVSILSDSGTNVSDDHPPLIASLDSDQLPEGFRAVSLPVADVRQGEADKIFVREQPW